MKKVLFSIIFSLFFISQLSAQLEIGARGSVAFFLPSGDGTIAERVSLLPGGEGGLFAGIALGRLASVRAELLYIYKKWTQEQSEPAILTLSNGINVNGFIEEILHTTNGYISIPVIMELELIKGFGINFGPNMAFLAKSVATGDLTSISDSLGELAKQELDYDYLNDLAGEGAYADLTEKIENLYKSLDIGWNVGLALDLSKRTKLDIRTTIGLTDIIDATYRQDFGSLLENNLTFTTGLRYYFAGNGVNKDDGKKKKK